MTTKHVHLHLGELDPDVDLHIHFTRNGAGSPGEDTPEQVMLRRMKAGYHPVQHDQLHRARELVAGRVSAARSQAWGYGRGGSPAQALWQTSVKSESDSSSRKEGSVTARGGPGE
jgi:hypothetical protein